MCLEPLQSVTSTGVNGLNPWCLYFRHLAVTSGEQAVVSQDGGVKASLLCWVLAGKGDSNVGYLGDERVCIGRCVQDGGDTAVSARCLPVGSSCDASRAQEVQQGVPSFI